MSKAIEVEIRILLRHRKAIEDKLRFLGAKTVGVSRLTDYWYCPAAAKNFRQAGTEKTGFALRIRESVNPYGGRKTSTLECKTLCDGKDHSLCHEHEMVLSDVAAMRHILADIGLREFLAVAKERTVYRYKRVKFCFDKIKGVGDGLEMEIMTKNNLTGAKQKLISLAGELGIKRQEILKKSLTYLAMEKLSKFE